MIIATASIGDSLITLIRVTPLTLNDMVTYNLKHTDIPTDKDITISFIRENDAVRAFAAWLAADEPDLTKDCAELRDSPMHKYMS